MDEREAFEAQQEARRQYASESHSRDVAIRRFLAGVLYRETREPRPEEEPERPANGESRPGR